MALPRRTAVLSPDEKPYEPLINAGALTSPNLRDAFSDEIKMGERQAIDRQRQEAWDARQAAQLQARQEAEAKKLANKVREDQLMQSGVRSYKDETGVIQPKMQPDDQGNMVPVYVPKKGEMKWDDQGAYQVNRDDKGQNTVLRPDAKAPLVENPNDPNDPGLYKKNKLSPWEYVDPNEAVKSPDPAVRNAAGAKLLGDERRKALVEAKKASSAKLTDAQLVKLSKEREMLATPEPPPVAKGPSFFGLGGKAVTPEDTAAHQAREDQRKAKLAELNGKLTAHSKVGELYNRHLDLQSMSVEDYLKGREPKVEDIKSAAAQLQAETDAFKAERDSNAGLSGQDAIEFNAKSQAKAAELAQRGEQINALAQEANAKAETERQAKIAAVKDQRSQMEAGNPFAKSLGMASRMQAVDDAVAESGKVIAAMPDGPEKDAAIAALDQSYQEQQKAISGQVEEKQKKFYELMAALEAPTARDAAMQDAALTANEGVRKSKLFGLDNKEALRQLDEANAPDGTAKQWRNRKGNQGDYLSEEDLSTLMKETGLDRDTAKNLSMDYQRQRFSGPYSGDYSVTLSNGDIVVNPSRIWNDTELNQALTPGDYTNWDKVPDAKKVEEARARALKLRDDPTMQKAAADMLKNSFPNAWDSYLKEHSGEPMRKVIEGFRAQEHLDSGKWETLFKGQWGSGLAGIDKFLIGAGAGLEGIAKMTVGTGALLKIPGAAQQGMELQQGDSFGAALEGQNSVLSGTVKMGVEMLPLMLLNPALAAGGRLVGIGRGAAKLASAKTFADGLIKQGMEKSLAQQLAAGYAAENLPGLTKLAITAGEQAGMNVAAKTAIFATAGMQSAGYMQLEAAEAYRKQLFTDMLGGRAVESLAPGEADQMLAQATDKAMSKARPLAAMAGVVTGMLTTLLPKGDQALQRFAMGLPSKSMTTPVSELVGKIGLKGFEKFLKSGTVAAGLGNFFLTMGIHGADEFTEEFLDELFQGTLSALTYDPKRTFGDVLAQAVDAGGMGAIMGFAGGSIDARQAYKESRAGVASAPTETPTLQQPEHYVAAEQAIARYVGPEGVTPESVELDKRKMSAMVTVAKGEIDTLGQEDLALLGLTKDNGEYKKAPGATEEIITFPENDGVPVISQGAIDRVTAAVPELANVIRPEQTVRQAALNRPTFEVDVQTPAGAKSTIPVQAKDEADARAQVAAMGKGMVGEVRQTGAVPPVAPAAKAPEPISAAVTELESKGAQLDQKARQVVGKLDQLLTSNLEAWKNVFSGVEWRMETQGTGGLMMENGKLVVSVADLLGTVKKVGNLQKWLGPALMEEAVHAVAVKLDKGKKINVGGLYDSLPQAVRDTVSKLYAPDPKDSPELTRYKQAHEFLRYYMNGRLTFKNGKWSADGEVFIAEQASDAWVAKLKAVLEQLLAYFRDVESKINDDAVKAQLRAAGDAIEAELKALQNNENQRTTTSTEATTESKGTENQKASAKGTDELSAKRSGGVESPQTTPSNGSTKEKADQGRQKNEVLNAPPSAAPEQSGAVSTDSLMARMGDGPNLPFLREKLDSSKVNLTEELRKMGVLAIRWDDSLGGRFWFVVDSRKNGDKLTDLAIKFGLSSGINEAGGGAIVNMKNTKLGDVADKLGLRIEEQPSLGDELPPMPESTVEQATADKLGIPVGAVGNSSTVSQNGKKVKVRFVAIERKDLKPSHRSNGAATAGYDQSLQPRDRSLPEYRKQAQNIGQNLSFEQAAFFPETTTPATTADLGAPVMDDKKQVVIGNGRTIGIDYAYAHSEPSADRYKAEFAANAAAFGLDADTVAGMNEPVLVRVIDQEIFPEELIKFSQESNKGAAMASNAVEVAAEDATRIDAELLSMLDPNFDLDSRQNEDFRKAYIQRVILGRSKQDKSGSNEANVTPAELAGRIRRGIFASAFGLDGDGRAALDRMAGDIDDAAKKITKGLLSVAGPYAWMRGQIAAGSLHDMDIATEIGAAAQSLAVALRDRGKASAKAVYAGMESEQEMPGFSSDLKGLVQAFILRERSSANRIAHGFSNYVEAVNALGNPGQLEMFNAPELPSKAELFERVTSADRLDADEQGHALSSQQLAEKFNFESAEVEQEISRPGRKAFAAAYLPPSETRTALESLHDLVVRNGDGSELAGEHQIMHMTLGYGLKEGANQQVISALKDIGPISVEIDRLDILPGKGKDQLVAVVKGETLERLGVSMRPLLEKDREATFHVTIAVTKPGNGQKYLTDKSLLGRKIHLSSAGIIPAANTRQHMVTVHLSPQQDVLAHAKTVDDAFYLESSLDNDLPTYGREEVVAHLSTIPVTGFGAPLTVTLLVPHETTETGQDIVLMSRLAQAGGSVEKVWAGTVDVVKMAEFYQRNGNLPKELVELIARHTGEPMQVMRLTAPASVITAMRKTPGPSFEVGPKDKSRVFTDAPEITTTHQRSQEVHQEIWKQLNAIGSDVRAVGSGVSGVAIPGSEDDLDYMIVTDDVDGAAAAVAALPFGFKEEGKAFTDSKTGLPYRKFEIAWDNDGYFDGTIDANKDRLAKCLGKSDVGIVESSTWGKRMTAHAFLRYMDPEFKKSSIDTKKAHQAIKKALNKELALPPDDFKKHPRYKEWKQRYSDAKFRILLDVDRQYGSAAFKDYRDEHTGELLRSGKALPMQQLLRNSGELDLYHQWRGIQGMPIESEIIAPSDPAVRLNTADKTTVTFWNAEGDWDLGVVMQSLGIKGGQTMGRSDYWTKVQGLIEQDLNRSIQGEDSQLPFTNELIHYLRDGDVLGVREIITDLVPEAVVMRRVKDSRQDGLTGSEIQTRTQSLLENTAIRAIINSYGSNPSTTQENLRSLRSKKQGGSQGILKTEENQQRQDGGNQSRESGKSGDENRLGQVGDVHPALNTQQLDLFADFVNTVPLHERTPKGVAQRVKAELPKPVADDLFAWSQNATKVSDESRTSSPGGRKSNGGKNKQSGKSEPVWEVAGQDDLFQFAAGLGATGQSASDGNGNVSGERGVRSDANDSVTGRGPTTGLDGASDGNDQRGRADGTPGFDADLAEIIPTPANEADRNARINPGETLVPKGQGAKIAANFKVIELLRMLTAEGRNPTTEEKAQLLTYSGWGHSKGGFDDAKAKAYENVSGGWYDQAWAQDKVKFKRDHNAHYIDRATGKPQASVYDLYAWNEKWGDVHRELREKLSAKEYNAAKRSVLNAHYTTPAIIDAQWKMVEKLGFKGGKALEPGAGIGHYIGTQPEHLAKRTIWSAVELDQVTSQILALLYPQARVNSVSSKAGREVVGQGFEEALIADNSQDVVISNVPFHETGPWQSEKEFKTKLNLHNYFFARALKKVKPGGLIVFITSSSTMENNADQRRFLASRGELISAVRLPNNAFEENAGTQVTTDIIIMRKPDGRKVETHAWAGTRVVGRDTVSLKRGDETPTQYLKAFDLEGNWQDESLEAARKEWNDLRVAGLGLPKSSPEAKANSKATAEAWKSYLKAFETAEANAIGLKLRAELPIRVNEYFAANPQNAFGRHSLSGSMYRADEYALQEDLSGGTLEERFAKVIEALPADIMGQAYTLKLNTVRDVERADRPFSFVERDGKFWQVQGSSLVPVEWTNPEQLVFRSWSKVKNAVRDLVAAELDPKTESAELTTLREALNTAYNKHVAFFGPISKTGVGQKHKHLGDDPDFPLTVALETPEQFTNRKGKSETRYIKADIFRVRMNKPLSPPTTAQTPSDALLASLVWMGYPHIPYMAKLLGRSEASVREEVIESELVFNDPVSGNLVIRDSYLSGFVQGKLDDARAAAIDDPAYQRNVAALVAALPERKGIAQIGVSMNSPWLPPEVLTAFMEHLGISDAQVEYLTAANSWTVTGIGNSEEFSTEDVPTKELVEHILAMTVPRVTETIGRGTDKRVVFDPAATQLAKSKLDKLKMEFQRWAKTSDAQVGGKNVQEVIVDAFNSKANGIKPPAFSGDHITLPGASDEVYRSSIRRSAIARMIDQGSGMIAHGVGFGKTYTLISLAMELKRLGKANRPMIIVENATLTQFAASFRTAYPNANVLVADEKSFSGKNRRQFIARIATGDHDAILMAHSQFNLIANHPDVVNNYINEQVAELEAARALTDSSDRRAVAALEKAKIGLENSRKKILDSLATRQDNGLFWEDLGIDTLMVDEAHRYKNAPVITRMQGMKNLPTGEPSQRAVGMVLKTKGIQAKMAGRGVFFATGTPVSNSMAEAFVMLRYTSPQLLKDQGIENFDQFVASFGVSETKAEANWKGAVSMETRLSKFINGNALINLVRSSWDVQMDPEVAGIKRPQIKGGEAQQVMIKPGTANQAYNDWVVNTVARQWDDPEYWNALGGKKEAFENNPALSAIPIMTMQAGIAAALDIRLIDPNAADYAGSKVNTAVKKIIENYKSTSSYSGTQAVFADLRESFSIDHLLSFAGDPGLSEKGMEIPEEVPVVLDEEGNPLPAPKKPKKAKEFDLYQDIANKLVAAGIPRGEIGLISSSMSPEKRTEIFDKVNSGEIRVIVGSTDLMGVGVNMQERLHSMHHLMPPRDFKPASQEQRTGRILRQGNLHYDMALEAFVASAEKSTGKTFRKDKGGKMVPDMASATAALDADGLAKAEAAAEQFHIEEYQYAMEKSIDSAVFSMMAAKQRMVVQLLMGEVTDSFEDPSDAISMGMAEIAARAIGDPILIRRVELEREIRELTMEFQGFQNDLMSARSELNYTQYELSKASSKMEQAQQAADTVGKIGTDPERETVWTFGGQTVDRNKPKDAGKGWKSPKLIEALDTFLLNESIALNKSESKFSRTQIEVDGVKFTVEIHQSLGDTRTAEQKYADAMAQKDSTASAKGSIYWVRDPNNASSFAGAQSLIGQVNSMARYYAGLPAKQESERLYYEKKLPAVQRKATQTFDRADELAALHTEMDQVEALLVAQSAPPPPPAETAVSKAAKKGITLPPVTPVDEKFMTPQVRDIIERSTIKDSALTLPEELDRKVYEAVNKALESAGGRWDRSTKTHLFAENPSVALGLESPTLGTQRLTGSNLTKIYRKLSTMPNRNASQESLFRKVEKQLGQGFLLQPWDGIKEIPPGPGIVKGDGVLLSQSFEDLMTEAGIDFNEIDDLLAVALGEQSGQRTVGEPRRALSMIDPVIMATDQAYQDNFEAQTVQQWQDEAVMMYLDPSVYETYLESWVKQGLAGITLDSPAKMMAAKLMVIRETAKPMTPAQLRKVAALRSAYNRMGTEIARMMRSRVDPMMTPAQRNREYLAGAIFDAAPEVKTALETATPQERTKIMAAEQLRISKIEAALKQMGVSLDDIFNGEVELSLKGAKMLTNRMAALDAKTAQAIKLIQEGNTIAQAAKLTGLPASEVERSFDDFRAKLLAEVMEKVANGLRFENLDVSALSSQSLIDVRAEAERILAAMGIPQKKDIGKRRIVKRKVKIFTPPRAAQEGKPLTDMGGPTEGTQPRLPNVDPTGKPLTDQGGPTRGLPGDLNIFQKEEMRTTPGNQAPRMPVNSGLQGDLNIFGEKEYSVKVDLSDDRQVALIIRRVQQANSSKFDMGMEYYINGLMSGPQTWIGNTVSGAVSGIWEMTAQRGMELMINTALRDKKGAQWGELKHMLAGISYGVVNGWRRAIDTWKYEADFFKSEVLPDEENDMFSKIVEGHKTAIPGKIGRVVRGIGGRINSVVDTFWKSTFAQMEVGAQAYRIAKSEGLSGKAMEDRIKTLIWTPGSKAWHLAVEKAQQITFQQDLKSRKKGGSIPEAMTAEFMKFRNSIPLLGLIVPFVKTPFNIFRTGIRKSPFGALNLAYQVGKGVLGKQDYKTSHPELLRDLAEQTLAWIMTAMLIGAAEGDDDDDDKMFLITGSAKGVGSERTSDREAQNRRAGGSYIVRIGGRDGVVIPYGRIEPVATVMGATIDFLKALKSSAPTDRQGKMVMDWGISQIRNKSFLQGIASLMDVLDPQMGGNGLERMGQNFLKALVPNLIRSPLREMNQNIPETRGSPWWYQMIPLPGAVPDKIDSGSGKPMEKGGNEISRVIWPGAIRPDSVAHPADKLLDNYARLHPTEKWYPGPPDRNLQVKGVTVELNPEAFNYLSVRSGTLARNALAGLTQQQQTRPTEDDQKFVKKAYEDARAQARDELKRRPLEKLGTVSPK